jgi:hypothetical protein
MFSLLRVVSPIRHRPEQVGPDPIAFARRRLEFLALENRDRATAIGNESSFLQRTLHDRHCRPRLAKHHRDEFLRQRKLVLANAILSDQKRARESLLDCMNGITGCRLHDEQRSGPSAERCARPQFVGFDGAGRPVLSDRETDFRRAAGSVRAREARRRSIIGSPNTAVFPCLSEHARGDPPQALPAK